LRYRIIPGREDAACQERRKRSNLKSLNLSIIVGFFDLLMPKFDPKGKRIIRIRDLETYFHDGEDGEVISLNFELTNAHLGLIKCDD
jgi:hypothetical protein